MGTLITEAELKKMVSEFLELHKRQPRTWPAAVLAHQIIRLLDERQLLDERKKVRTE